MFSFWLELEALLPAVRDKAARRGVPSPRAEWIHCSFGWLPGLAGIRPEPHLRRSLSGMNTPRFPTSLPRARMDAPETERQSPAAAGNAPTASGRLPKASGRSAGLPWRGRGDPYARLESPFQGTAGRLYSRSGSRRDTCNWSPSPQRLPGDLRRWWTQGESRFHG